MFSGIFFYNNVPEVVIKLILYLVLHNGIDLLLRVIFREDFDSLSKFNIFIRHRGRLLLCTSHINFPRFRSIVLLRVNKFSDLYKGPALASYLLNVTKRTAFPYLCLWVVNLCCMHACPDVCGSCLCTHETENLQSTFYKILFSTCQATKRIITLKKNSQKDMKYQKIQIYSLYRTYRIS